MKALVIYDSLYGNTEKIAHAIGNGLSGSIGESGSVRLVRVGDAHPDLLAGLDLLLVGSPTHASKPSPATRDFLDHIPKKALAGVKVAAFDTRGDLDTLGVPRLISRFLGSFFAAPGILSSLEKRGGHRVKPDEGFFVKDTEGPLRDGELQRATDWGREIAAQLEA
jgi:flavodoxin